jgi:hypothetical protein
MKGVGVGVIVIKFSVYNQRLRRITSGIIPLNAYGKLKFEFDFRTDDWDIVEDKTANFYYNGKNYRIKLDKNNQCFVPKQVIYPTSFSVSIDGGDIVTNSIKNYVEGKPGEATIPDIDDDELNTGDINILDGGAIILDLTDDPTEDDESNPSDEKDTIDYIAENNIPFYSGLVDGKSFEVEYRQLSTLTANYTDQGFYMTNNNEGKTTNAGYQITFKENPENKAQTFSIYSNAKIVTAYQYQPAFNQWLDMGFDGVYWIENGTTTQIVNGKNISYTTYVYNEELMGDVITSPEYWRFEVEVV